MDFIFRLYQDDVRNPTLSDINFLSISGLPIVAKNAKFEPIITKFKAQEKFGYKVYIKQPQRIVRGAGSHSYPKIAFKGSYLDIIVKNFPRYPALSADYYACRNIMNSKAPYQLMFDEQFPIWTEYRKFEIIPL